eukprot:CAMPEP_0181326080 /NCGR_PEP_ID=MMETSP1101-20121128/21290_1 /TAXON_ID=46948 /ORGANISM="Rhodomonas abbreviata, Strain Caron Lab Isolate" /LENGTH=68 /DNA_ID=CAMNT_0023434475 /DNA_START=134 /DNA_END=340 /DNA_ORIENTATION=+
MPSPHVVDQAAYDKMSSGRRFLFDYSRRYMRAGKPSPVFHFIGTVFVLGVLVEAKAHKDHAKDPFEAH